MAKVKIGNVYPSHQYLMERCAPAGFGLGGNGELVEISSINELDSLSNNGWYTIHSSNNLTAGGLSFSACVLEISSLSETYGWQIIRFLGKNSILIRHKNNNVWGEWEWENPPMELGKEYRTTERWNGKPVYIKSVDLGNLPDTANSMGATWVDGSFYGSGVKSVIACGGCMYKGTEWSGALPYFSVGVQVYVVASNTTVGLWASDGSFKDRTATVWVKYTKE